jgi:hypothetical protein
MPAFSLARLSGPAGAVKGSLRRASPALDRAFAGRPSSDPTHSLFKRGSFEFRMGEGGGRRDAGRERVAFSCSPSVRWWRLWSGTLGPCKAWPCGHRLRRQGLDKGQRPGTCSTMRSTARRGWTAHFHPLVFQKRQNDFGAEVGEPIQFCDAVWHVGQEHRKS